VPAFFALIIPSQSRSEVSASEAASESPLPALPRGPRLEAMRGEVERSVH
jgi:hypothetical protein